MTALLTPEEALQVWDAKGAAVNSGAAGRAHAVARAQLARCVEAVRGVGASVVRSLLEHGATDLDEEMVREVVDAEIAAVIFDAGAEPGGGQERGPWPPTHEPAQPAASPGAVERVTITLSTEVAGVAGKTWLFALLAKHGYAFDEQAAEELPAPPEPPRAEGFDAERAMREYWASPFHTDNEALVNALRRAHAAGLASGLETAARIAIDLAPTEPGPATAVRIVTAIRARAREVKP